MRNPFAVPSSVAAIAAATTTALLLASCSTADESDSADGTAEVVTPTGVTIDMPEDPQAAMGFYTTDLDLLVTFGVPLAETQPIRDDFTDFPDFFPQEELSGLDTFGNYPEFNLEAVANANPDFILNGLGYEEDLDGQLQAIAPTYTYNAFDGTDWRDSAGKAAQDLGREEQWQAWEDEYRAKVDDIRTRLDEQGIDPVVAALDIWNDEVQTSCYGVPCLVFADLGLNIAPQMDATDAGLPAGDPAYLSMEQVGQLEGIDVVFTQEQEDGDVPLRDDESLQRNPLWEGLTFVEDDEIFSYNYEMSFGSPSGQMAFLEVVEKALLGES